MNTTIYLLVDEHFQFFTFTNRTSMNINVQIFVWVYAFIFSFFLGKYLKMEWLGHIAGVFGIHKEHSKLNNKTTVTPILK